MSTAQEILIVTYTHPLHGHFMCASTDDGQALRNLRAELRAYGQQHRMPRTWFKVDEITMQRVEAGRAYHDRGPR